ncbi:MAG TPA: sensor histidine kinase [Polaromonas sp.]|uniref:sensor histidine kinase n=1 Tax=Polaromonas sp. TaxID=1869339 RepID=UPI002D6C5452|nr:sensor histidine kinase [Polaromonas sp.]HYW58098.1 sensor histidine kinase [Polaromonas sp.]
MRLSEFLRTQTKEILEAWDEFAATVEHTGTELDKQELRDHAAEILQTIAEDLDRPQTEDEQVDKSKGLSDSTSEGEDTAAQTHADIRMISGFAVDAMITEYRALRSSVVRLWLKASGESGHARDVIDLTRFNEAIDQAIAESVGRYTEQTKRSTDLFIGILGHDIRNPLGTISMSAQYLVRSGQLTAAAAEPIINSVVRINSVIEQVVDFTRGQAEGVMPIHPKPGNLVSQFFKVVEETQVRHPNVPVRLDSTGNFDGSWDEGRMGQLLSNLLGNAISYGASNEPVTVYMWENREEVFFSVHNTGNPIPPQEQERIFKPLARGAGNGGGERREPDGLGLGLYICKEIVRAHGGTMGVESAPGSGTTFNVKLPRRPAPVNPL